MITLLPRNHLCNFWEFYSSKLDWGMLPMRVRGHNSILESCVPTNVFSPLCVTRQKQLGLVLTNLWMRHGLLLRQWCTLLQVDLPAIIVDCSNTANETFCKDLLFFKSPQETMGTGQYVFSINDGCSGIRSSLPPFMIRDEYRSNGHVRHATDGNPLYSAELATVLMGQLQQVFQLRFYALNRRIRKRVKNQRRYRRVFCYVRENRRFGVLGRFLASFLKFTPARLYSQRISATLGLALQRDNTSPLWLIHSKQQIAVLATLLMKV